MNLYWNNYVSVLKRYADFKGKAGLGEFWKYFLVNLIIGALLGSVVSRDLSSLYSLIVLVPTLAVGARRLHDTGRSGWLQLIGLIPVLGLIVLLILFAQPSKRS